MTISPEEKAEFQSEFESIQTQAENTRKELGGGSGALYEVIGNNATTLEDKLNTLPEGPEYFDQQAKILRIRLGTLGELGVDTQEGYDQEGGKAEMIKRLNDEILVEAKRLEAEMISSGIMMNIIHKAEMAMQYQSDSLSFLVQTYAELRVWLDVIKEGQEKLKNETL